MADESRNKRGSEDDMDEDGDRPSKKQRYDDFEGVQAEGRFLLPSKNAGAVIGRGGENVKRLRQDFQASISLPDSNGPERLMIVKGTIGTICGIMKEVIPIIERCEGEECEECDVRLLVHQSQAGRIIGKGGERVKDIREDTGAQIRVYTECCPQSTDRLCQLTGSPTQVTGALGRILSLLDGSPSKGVVALYNPNNFDEFFSQEYGGYADFRGGPRGGGRGGGRDRMDRGGGGGDRRSSRGGMGGRDRFDRNGGGGRDFGGRGGRGDFDRGRRGDFEGRGGMGGGMGGMGMGFGGMGGAGMMGGGFGGMKAMMGGGMGEKTVSSQVSIPKALAGAIIGKGGTRIRQVQMESGTVIKMDDASTKSDERIITIHGTQEQIQYAQYLLQMTVKQHATVQ